MSCILCFSTCPHRFFHHCSCIFMMVMVEMSKRLHNRDPNLIWSRQKVYLFSLDTRLPSCILGPRLLGTRATTSSPDISLRWNLDPGTFDHCLCRSYNAARPPSAQWAWGPTEGFLVSIEIVRKQISSGWWLSDDAIRLRISQTSNICTSQTNIHLVM